MMPARTTYALFGAAPDTSNRGVSALFRSAAEGLADTLPESELLVFDNDLGVRKDSIRLASGADYAFSRIGARGGKRYYVPENLATMAAFASLGPAAGRLHPYIRVLDRCDAILDISGGDSFSDIYGSHRFWSILRPKLIAERRGIPLVLLPQTYGPFRGKRARRLAREAVSAATLAWARDRYSFEGLQRLLGSDFDESRHRQGVDMAFNLRTVDPGAKLDPEIREWIHEKGHRPLIGLNVSGLIALDPVQAERRFQLRARYLDALADAVQLMLRQSDLRLLLIPHVMSPRGSPESDVEGCARLTDRIPASLSSRIRVSPTDLDECEVKWLISQMDWFCGTRMHSTIAALSSRVPTAAIAYSDKTRGVFESCGVESQVIDPRQLETREVAASLFESFEQREEIQRLLSTTIAGVKQRATDQLQRITDVLKGLG